MLLIMVLIFGIQNSNGQTVLLDPSGDGGFENGSPSTLGTNGWTPVSANTSFWEVSNIATPLYGNNGVYVANTTNTYSYDKSTNRTSHFYKDVTIPTGATAITLSFYWKGKGESGKDRTLIYTAPTTVTPAINVPSSSASSTSIPGATLIWTQPSVQSTLAYTFESIILPSNLAGSTVRFIFTWQNDGSVGSTPGAAIDNISLVACSPLSGNISVGTGADYTSLTGPNGLFAAINSCGLSGNVTANITSNLNETGEVSLNQWSETGIGNYTLTIQPDATTTRVISGTTVATGQPMINFNGADRVTINGINKNLLFKNTNTTPINTGSAIQFTNGSLNCSITNCDVQSNSTTTTYGTIVVGSTGTNSVTISNNNIHGTASGNSYSSIYSNNAANTLTITNNNIFDFIARGVFANNIANGIEVSGNNFFQTAICNNSFQYSIDIRAGLGHTISNNYIGGTTPNCGGSSWENTAKVDFRAIYLSVGTTTVTSVQGNTIQNIKLSSVNNSSTATLFYMISVGAGLVNVGSVSGNIIGHATSANSILIAGCNTSNGSALIHGYNASLGSRFENNLIANITYTGTSAPTFNGIVLNGNAKNNAIYSIGASEPNANPFIIGLNIAGSGGGEVSNNFVALSGGTGATQSEIYGIYDNSATGATYTIYYNSVNITGSPTSFVTTWAFYRGSTSTTNYVLKNNIFANQRTAATGSSYNGAIYVNQSGSFTSDYNDLYAAGTTYAPIGFYNGSYKTSFANWQASFTGCDTNAVNVLPQFTSNTDLHLLSSNCGIDGKATPIAITKDYDGQTRDAIHPDIGADEFTGVVVIPSITTPPSNVSIAAGANAVFSTIASGNPSSYLWELSTNNGSTWSTVNNGGVYTNATTASLTISAAPASMNGYLYRATAINSCGRSVSTSAKLIITIVLPVNDDTCFAIPLVVNSTCTFSTYSNLNATASAGIPAPGCANYLGGDVWFTAVVPANGTLIINTQAGVLLDSGLAIYSGTCNSLTLISCNDDSSSSTMSYIVKSGLVPGSTIYIRVWEFGNNNNGTFGICVTTPAPPNTQDCLGAIAVCNTTYATTNSYSGTGNISNEINTSNSCLASGEKNDVWYTFTVINSGNLIFTITPNQVTDDYDWAIYNLTNASCSDIYNNPALMVSCNFSATSGTTGLSSTIGNGSSQSSTGSAFNSTIPVTAGQTYVVNISNFSATQNGYTLNFGTSSATIYDNVAPTIQAIVQPIACGATSLGFNFSETVLCSSVTDSLFTLTGPGGTYSLSGVSGPSCSIGGAQENDFTINVSPALTVAGNYRLNYNGNVTDLCGNVAPPNFFNFTITNGITANAGSNQTVCAGTNITLIGSANGGSSYTYSWSPTTGLSNPNSNTTTISNPANSPASSTQYTLTATSAGCSAVATTTIMVAVIPPTPGIITGGASQCPNTNSLTYSIASVSGATSYNWTVPAGWSITSGQGTTSIIVTSGNSGQNGNITVNAANNCGTSSASSLAVTLYSVLNAGAHSISVLNGCVNINPVELIFTTASSGGNLPYSYQWQNNTIDISGAVFNSYDPPNLIVAGIYSYRCKITDACGNVVYTSPKIVNVALDPNAPSAIMSPITTSVCAGTVLTLINPIYGTQPGQSCGFEYITSIDNGSTWSPIVTTPPSISATGTNNRIKIRVANSCSSGCSASPYTEYIWTVTPITTIILQPSIANQSICKSGAATTLSVTASGSGLSYQWYSNSSTTPISGATNATFSPPTNTVGSSTYYCIVSGSCGSITSNSSGTITINPIPITNPIYHE